MWLLSFRLPTRDRSRFELSRNRFCVAVASQMPRNSLHGSADARSRALADKYAEIVPESRTNEIDGQGRGYIERIRAVFEPISAYPWSRSHRGITPLTPSFAA
jgi:hypothetical protein